MPVSHTHPLVDTRFLASAPPTVRIADVRWYLTGASGWEKYREGHIPGAVFVDLDRDLSRPGGPGRHPFPATEDFARFLGRIGVGPETHVVAYDDAGGSIAARFWFLLRVHGHERASVLDGGFQAWKAAGLPVTTEDPRISPVEPPVLVLDRRRLAERAEVEAVTRRKAGEGGPILTDAATYQSAAKPVNRRFSRDEGYARGRPEITAESRGLGRVHRTKVPPSRRRPWLAAILLAGAMPSCSRREARLPDDPRNVPLRFDRSRFVASPCGPGFRSAPISPNRCADTLSSRSRFWRCGAPRSPKNWRMDLIETEDFPNVPAVATAAMTV